MRIKSFEEIEAWKKARVLCSSIYKISEQNKFEKDWPLRDQVRRAAISVMSNIAEGFDSGFPAEFSRFLNIAKRSASEVQSQIYIALDQGYVSQKDFSLIYKEAELVRKMISGLIKYLKSCRSGQLATG
jgi:four helix bundle protein